MCLVDGMSIDRICEKMQFIDQCWTQINSMNHPRSHFTPCHFRSLLYLASTYSSKVETFNAEAETFAVLPVSLPVLSSIWSVAFIARGELCLLTEKNEMARWKIETECEFHISQTNKASSSTQQPQRTLFCLRRQGHSRR